MVYGQNIWVPSKFIYWVPNPQDSGIWNGALEDIQVQLDDEVGNIMMGLMALKEKKKTCLSLPLLCLFISE